MPSGANLIPMARISPLGSADGMDEIRQKGMGMSFQGGAYWASMTVVVDNVSSATCGPYEIGRVTIELFCGSTPSKLARGGVWNTLHGPASLQRGDDELRPCQLPWHWQMDPEYCFLNGAPPPGTRTLDHRPAEHSTSSFWNEKGFSVDHRCGYS